MSKKRYRPEYILSKLREADIIRTVRPHRSLNYKSPAPETILPGMLDKGDINAVENLLIH